MKALKLLLGVILSVVVLVAGYLLLFFDANDFKGQIADAVQQQTGRQLVIAEDIQLSIFPSVSLQLGGVSLSNPAEVSELPMFAAKAVQADVALMPLLQRQLQVGELVFEGIELNLVTLADGRSSMDGLVTQSEPSAQAQTPEPSGQTSQGLSGLVIDGVRFENAKVLIDNRKDKSKTEFLLNHFRLDRFELDQQTPFSLDWQLAAQGMSVASQMTGDLTIAASMQQIAISGSEMNTTYTPAEGEPLSVTNRQAVNLDLAASTAQLSEFSAAVMGMNIDGQLDVNYGAKVPDIKLALNIDKVDLDALSGGDKAEAEPASGGSDKPAAKPANETEPDLSGLGLVNFEGDLSIGEVKVAGLTTTNWVVSTVLKDSVLKLSELSADLYSGKLSASATLDARKSVATYSFDERLNGVQIQPLLKDLADVDLLAGTANFNIQGKGSSLIANKLKRNLNANGDFAITDGAVYGINIPQKIRDAQAAMKGDLNASSEAEKTDFTSMTGSLNIADGKVNNPDLLMESPLLRVSGAGGADLMAEQLDYLIKAKLVGSLSGQGGDRDLSGLEVPIKISGNFTEPKFGVDTEALLKERVDEEKDKLKEKLQDKLKERFKGFGF
ncbi:AsmA family protein [Paraferrimonas sedimenticola]|uniref:Cell envelope biogenesis protein AsmA n=1 Tax=Paraferrimonas sedimenticola TaxID=375674 RepID=A0AA37RVS1_9GAMM|nr:AsmA family protein [Paraferrimonas sedimenticola]GLP96201.1 cell envelope biogenesis protein AsmA [Paraferrimonas sedimenticola]